ncbi:MAG TPA: histidine--tRNA ligase [Candidatus Saccharimonadales bacterium]|nr:histidine--tRNA ligase [Candidatus Saccharimonadales bacterium]
MDKTSFLPLSGFRDQLGPAKSWVINELQKTFQSYGYQALETPAIERQEILLGKLGDEGQKQLYLFEDNGKRQVGLRYDLTVPLSRFVAANLSELPLPFKRFEIGSSWRAERPQKGRYRQFTQADIDIIGAPEPSSELELMSVVAAAGERLGVKLTCLVNDRRLITAVFDELKIPAKERVKITQLFDKKDKLPEDEFIAQFKQLGLSDVERRQLSAYFLAEGDEALEKIEQLLPGSPAFITVKAVLAWAKKRGVEAVFAPGMVRGLDYYTGTIFEFKADGYDGGTVVAGGRYDNLIANLTGQRVPAVGLSFGVDRLSDLLTDQKPDDTLFVVRLPETSNEVNMWVRELRKNGKNVEVYLDDTIELGKQIKYADKRGYANILIPFENEWQRGQIVRKFLATGKQEAISRDQI